MKIPIILRVKGKEYALEVKANESLLNVLREQLSLTGTKYGCGIGECGACTVLIDNQPINSLDYGGNWRASSYIGGSPGYGDPGPVRGVMLNEVAAHTDYSSPPWDSNDWIELFNPPEADAVNLEDWYLSDDPAERNDYTLPD